MDIVCDPRWPGRWVVLAEWYGTLMPVFEADPHDDPFIQVWDCLDYARELEG